MLPYDLSAVTTAPTLYTLPGVPAYLALCYAAFS